MNSRLRSAALAAIVVFAAGRATTAAIVVGLVLDPATTAGISADVNSIYSGLGTWHLFAVDDNNDDFGISSYNIDLTGATAIRHTSPSAYGIGDANGDYHEAGFNTLRSANGSTGSSFIQASQPLPDQSPFLITGLGQQAGNLAAVTGGASPSGVTSSSWGDYSTISPLNGKNWMFLAEGKYDQGVLPSISRASFTVFNNSSTFSSKMSSTAIVPEPMTPAMLTPEYLAHISTSPPAPPAPQPVVVAPSNPPVVVPSPVVNPPVVNPPVVPQPVVPSRGYTPYLPPTVIPPTPSAPTQPVAPHPADEAVVVGMVVNPGSENGGSPGTWQLFAVDNNASDFGISSYNVNISGAKTARHTSPSTHALQDSDGNPIDGGFNTLRGVSGADGSYSIHAAQNLPGQSPLLITGFGQGTGSFAAEATSRLGSTTLPAATSPDWGDYSNISPLNGKNWLLLAEGTYDTPAPPTISQAAFTVYSDPTSFTSVMSPVTVVPEPITPTLLTQEYFQHLTPPPAPVEVPTVTQPEQQPIVVPLQPQPQPQPAPPIETPSTPAADDPDVPPTGVDPQADPGWTIIVAPWWNSEEFVYFTGDPLIDIVRPVYAYPLIGGEYLGDSWLSYPEMGELNQVDVIPALGLLSFNALRVDHDGMSTAGYAMALSATVGAFDSIAMRDAAPTPEPGGLFLAIAAQWSLLALARRRRGLCCARVS